MSLVHDALQKAEREKLRKTGVAPIASEPASSTPAHLLGAEPKPATLAKALGRTPAPAAVTAEPQRAHHGLLTALIVCVAVVAMVAIVYLVSTAATTIRESKQAVNTTPSSSVFPSTSAARDEGARATPITPTAPPPSIAAPATDSRFKLTGIMKNPEGQYGAVLNGRVVYEGHYVDGATVKKIERDRITLEVGGRDQVVRLF